VTHINANAAREPVMRQVLAVANWSDKDRDPAMTALVAPTVTEALRMFGWLTTETARRGLDVKLARVDAAIIVWHPAVDAQAAGIVDQLRAEVNGARMSRNRGPARSNKGL
jgi:hypothetical protein